MELGGFGGNVVVPVAEGKNVSAVDGNPHIRINSSVAASSVSGSIKGSAVDDEPAVGINSVAFGAESAFNGEFSAVYGGYGNSVLVGVDAVVFGINSDNSAVDRKMHFASDAFVFRIDIEHAGVFGIAADVHAHFRIQCGVVFMELLCFGVIFIDFCDVCAADIAEASVRGNDVCAGGGGINLGRCFRFGIRGFIDVIENNRRCDFACDIRAAEDEGNLCIRVGFRFFAEVNRKLAFQLAGDKIFAGFCNGNKSMGSGFLLGMLIFRLAFAIGVSAFVIIDIVIINNLAAGFYAVAFIRRFSVNGDSVFGKDDFCRVFKIFWGNFPSFADFRKDFHRFGRFLLLWILLNLRNFRVNPFGRVVCIARCKGKNKRRRKKNAYPFFHIQNSFRTIIP